MHKLNEYLDKKEELALKSDEELTHYGVKGMKWGVRKGTVTGKIKPRATLSLVDRLEQDWLDNAQGKGYSRVYRKAARKIRAGTRQLNNDPKFKGQNFKKDSPLRREYYKAYGDMVTDQLNAAVQTRLILKPWRKAGQSFSRKFELHFNSFDVSKELRPTATIRRTAPKAEKKSIGTAAKVTRKVNDYAQIVKDYSSKIKHTGIEDGMEDIFPEEGVQVSFEIDETGHILDIIFPGEESISQTMDLVDNVLLNKDETLMHWGVLGMKWGVRKARPGVTKVDSKRVTRITDEELKARISRIQLEKQYKQLSSPKIAAGKRILAGVLIGAATTVATVYVKNILDSAAKSGLEKMAGKGSKLAGMALANKIVNP